jgi:hypothetical protein
MTISWRSLVASIALPFLLTGAAFALPDYGPNCSGCHTRSAGAFNVSPSTLQLPMGQTRGTAINLTSSGGGLMGIGLTGLNAAGLAATADAAWTHQTSGGDWWTLGPFSGTLPLAKSLNLTPGAGAVRGSYLINVTFAGGSGGDWNKTGSFTVKVGVPGDYNDNGVVDAADYVLWRKGGPLQFEVDTPGTVNAADYTAWRARFGKTTAGAGSGSVMITEVPEPTTLMFVVLGLLAIPVFARMGRVKAKL